ncbi:MAG: hypothetical protein ACE37F_13065 [Nannocystaceae bacterium]|nr:hypothetical protein [bacterium]
MADRKKIAKAIDAQNADFLRSLTETRLIQQLDQFIADGDARGLRVVASDLRNQLGRHSSTRDEDQRGLLGLARQLALKGAATTSLGLQLRENCLDLLARHPRLRR